MHLLSSLFLLCGARCSYEAIWWQMSLLAFGISKWVQVIAVTTHNAPDEPVSAHLTVLLRVFSTTCNARDGSNINRVFSDIFYTIKHRHLCLCSASYDCLCTTRNAKSSLKRNLRTYHTSPEYSNIFWQQPPLVMLYDIQPPPFVVLVFWLGGLIFPPSVIKLVKHLITPSAGTNFAKMLFCFFFPLS